MKKLVYITGCLGFIASHLTRRCLELGWYVRGVDKLTYASTPDLLEEFNSYENFEFQEDDINDIKFLYDCDYVINAAAETHVGNSIVCSQDFVHSNIKGVHNLLERIRHFRQEGKDVPIFFHFSTDEVYGDIGSGEHTENDLVKPSNPYSATKASADMLVLAWHRTYQIPYIILRPTNNYGTHQYVEKLVAKTCKYIKLGKKIPLHNDGSPIRNWLHAEDTASAVTTIIESGKVNVISAVDDGPISVALFVPLSLSSKNSIKPAEVELFFTVIPAFAMNGLCEVTSVSPPSKISVPSSSEKVKIGCPSSSSRRNTTLLD